MTRILPTLIHRLIQFGCDREAKRFERALLEPEVAQRTRLQEILGTISSTNWGRENMLSQVSSYEAFRDRFPVTEYTDWKSLIDRERLGERVITNQISRFEPTSGSTGERKWIPYTPEYLDEINRAARAWISDLYTNWSGFSGGSHYWSLSWIPTEMRAVLNTDDVTLFPWWQRAFLNGVMAKHPAIAAAATSEASWWATKLFVASQSDLSFISGWSPTYVLGLFRGIYEEIDEIADALESGRWGRFENELARFSPPRRSAVPRKFLSTEHFVRTIWPKLALVSSWEAGASRPFAHQLRSWMGNTPFQAKGLWATEGVVTFPWRGDYPVAIRSHFYEFRKLSDPSQIVPVWMLVKGDEVQPILTMSGGLLRYALPDRMRVVGFVGKTPSLEFLGRIGGVDLVGEKMGDEKAEQVLRDLATAFPEITPLFLGAARVGDRAQYTVVGLGTSERTTQISEFLETRLLEVHHYALARELHQMLPAGTMLYRSSGEIEPLLQKSAIKGQNKPRPIVLLGE